MRHCQDKKFKPGKAEAYKGRLFVAYNGDKYYLDFVMHFHKLSIANVAPLSKTDDPFSNDEDNDDDIVRAVRTGHPLPSGIKTARVAVIAGLAEDLELEEELAKILQAKDVQAFDRFIQDHGAKIEQGVMLMIRFCDEDIIKSGEIGAVIRMILKEIKLVQ